MNRLAKLLAACDLRPVTSLRALYNNNDGNAYDLDGIRIVCEETQRNTPEIVRFVISIPLDWLISNVDTEAYGIVIADYCLRGFLLKIQDIMLERMHVTKKEQYTGRIIIHEPSNKVLQRNAAYVNGGMLHLTLKIQFPVHMMSGRSVVNGKVSVRIVKRELGRAIKNFVAEFDSGGCAARITVYQRQCRIRALLSEKGYVCFIANGSILPREALSECPMVNAVPFTAPPEDEVTLPMPGGTTLTGMAIRQGVTVITGGGYSGKSTLLDAVLHGIYDHIPGDGREYCVTRRNSCKIAAEDGRPVTSLDITPFIRSMPGTDMSHFSTPHASGSTSQAANIMEAIAFGCNTLLIDEDRTATNFMIRDTRMKALIKNDPIIPFTDRVRQLYREAGVSTVLIIGGSSEYLDIADAVYFMEDFRIHNITDMVNKERVHPYEHFDVHDVQAVRWRQPRVLASGALTSFTSNAEAGKYREYMLVDGRKMTIGDTYADISQVESIISEEQAAAIAWICRHIALGCTGRPIDLMNEARKAYNAIRKEGLSFLLSPTIPVDDALELPHLPDILAAFARMGPL